MNFLEIVKYLPLIQQLIELLQKAIAMHAETQASNAAVLKSNAQVVAALEKSKPLFPAASGENNAQPENRNG